MLVVVVYCGVGGGVFTYIGGAPEESATFVGGKGGK